MGRNFSWNSFWIQFYLWFRGLIAAFIAGAASGITVVIVDPTNFNFADGLNKLLTVVVVNGIVGASLYLTRSPFIAYEPTITKRVKKVNETEKV